MNPIFRYTTVIVTLILTSIHVLILPANAMEGPHEVPHVHVNPIVELAQEDANKTWDTTQACIGSLMARDAGCSLSSMQA